MSERAEVNERGATCQLCIRRGYCRYCDAVNVLVDFEYEYLRGKAIRPIFAIPEVATWCPLYDSEPEELTPPPKAEEVE